MKKGPLSHQKIKYSFLDYVQLLMIGQAIRVMKVNRNAKKRTLFPPKWLRMTWNSQFCVAKKPIIIQGNFYERLHFHMDSCAISPTAPLLTIPSVNQLPAAKNIYWEKSNVDLFNAPTDSLHSFWCVSKVYEYF